MKTIHSAQLLVATFGFVALLTGASAANGTATSALLPPSGATISITIDPPAPDASMAMVSSTSVNPAPDAVRWGDIQDYTFEMRNAFFTGLKQMEAKLNNQLTELAGQWSTPSNANESAARTLALQELSRARTQLKLVGDTLLKATPQTWEQQKVRVGQAWAKAQSTYGKAKTIRAS